MHFKNNARKEIMNMSYKEVVEALQQVNDAILKFNALKERNKGNMQGVKAKYENLKWSKSILTKRMHQLSR